MMQERGKGRSQAVAAARAGMSERTARTYERRGVLPSQGRQPRTHRTRVNPFAEDWPWVVSQLEREAYFAQDPRPGFMAQSDFTHMTSLGITLGGVAFPHLLYHLVLPYSNVEAVRVCFSESFE